MKKIIFLIVAFLFAIAAMSQSDRYQNSMLRNIKAIDSVENIQQLTDLSNSFNRIGDAEKDKWLPYYYASYCLILSGYLQSEKPDPDVLDPLADKAEELLGKASALSEKNSEIEVLKKMIADLRLIADPMNRWQTYGQIGEAALNNAKTYNPDNPRIYLIEGQTKFYTPAEFGGGAGVAKPIFEMARNKYETFKPETALHPDWGKQRLDILLATLK